MDIGTIIPRLKNDFSLPSSQISLLPEPVSDLRLELIEGNVKADSNFHFSKTRNISKHQLLKCKQLSCFKLTFLSSIQHVLNDFNRAKNNVSFNPSRKTFSFSLELILFSFRLNVHFLNYGYF